MRLEIDLSPELQARLAHVAAGLGMDVSEYVSRLLKTHLAPQAPVQAQASAPVASVARAAVPPPVPAPASRAAVVQPAPVQPAPVYAPPVQPAPVHATVAQPPFSQAPVTARPAVSVPLASGPVPFTEAAPQALDLSELTKKFNAAMVAAHERARNEAKYNSTRHAQTLSNYGGLETARMLLRAESPGEFFKALWQRKRLDLSIEALVIENPVYQPLFTEQMIATARSRLRQCNYSPSIKKR